MAPDLPSTSAVLLAAWANQLERFWDAIMHRDGVALSLKPPIALVDVQDMYLRRNTRLASIARHFGYFETADRLKSRGHELHCALRSHFGCPRISISWHWTT